MKQKINRIAAWITMLAVLLSLLSFSAFATENGELPPEQPAQEEPAEQPAPEAPVEQPAQEMPSEPMPTDPPATEPVTEPPTEAPTEAATTEPETEAPTEPEPTQEPRSMFQFTPDGQLTLVDDFEYVGMDADGNVMSKQFITVRSRDGSYFYIIIDRTGGTENVHFLNQVDLADLKTLSGNEKQPIDNGCTCTSKCTVGHIDTTCPVCSTNMSECAVIDGTGKKTTKTDTSQDAEPEDPDTSTDTKKQQVNPVLTLGLIVVAVGGILYYAFKGKSGGGKGKRRRKQQDFYFDEEDEDEEEELETEPAAPPTERLKPAAAEKAPDEEIIIEEDDFEDDGNLM